MALDCQIETEYNDAEWRAFVECARQGMTSGERLHHEYDAKIEAHGLSPRQVEHAVHGQAALAYYEHNGVPRLALWDPQQRVVVVGTVPDGLILTAYPLKRTRDHVEYISSFENVRWLRP
jgi:hypothetical protein